MDTPGNLPELDETAEQAVEALASALDQRLSEAVKTAADEAFESSYQELDRTKRDVLDACRKLQRMIEELEARLEERLRLQIDRLLQQPLERVDHALMATRESLERSVDDKLLPSIDALRAKHDEYLRQCDLAAESLSQVATDLRESLPALVRAEVTEAMASFGSRLDDQRRTVEQVEATTRLQRSKLTGLTVLAIAQLVLTGGCLAVALSYLVRMID